MNRGKAVVLLICSPLLLGLAMYLTGLLLPQEHVAVVEAELSVAPGPLLSSVLDIKRYPTWRREVDTVLEGDDPGSWTESGPAGRMGYQRLSQSRTHVETEVIDPSQEFGAVWRVELVPAGSGTKLTITEEGWIAPPVFRTISWLFLDEHRSMVAFTEDLAKHHQSELTLTKR